MRTDRLMWLGACGFAALSVLAGASSGGAQPVTQAGPHQPTLPQETGIDLELGAEVYLTNCQPCHGDAGKGDGPAARFLDMPPPDLTTGDWYHAVDGTLEEVVRVVGEGVEGTDMEPFAEILTEEEILAVAHYLLEKLAASP